MGALEDNSGGWLSRFLLLFVATAAAAEMRWSIRCVHYFQCFSCSLDQVSRVWYPFKQQNNARVSAVTLCSNRGGKWGRKGIDVAAIRDKLTQIPLKNRTTQRSVTAPLGIPHSTLTNNLKKPWLARTIMLPIRTVCDLWCALNLTRVRPKVHVSGQQMMPAVLHQRETQRN